jgi:hypothetical protein
MLATESHGYRFLVLYKCQDRLAKTGESVPDVAIAGGSIGTELCIILRACQKITYQIFNYLQIQNPFAVE